MEDLKNYAGLEDSVFFVQLRGSKLFRVALIPEKYCETDELFQVLRTLCIRYRKGMFFFKLDNEAQLQVQETMMHMGVAHWFIQPAQSEIIEDALGGLVNLN